MSARVGQRVKARVRGNSKQAEMAGQGPYVCQVLVDSWEDALLLCHFLSLHQVLVDGMRCTVLSHHSSANSITVMAWWRVRVDNVDGVARGGNVAKSKMMMGQEGVRW